MTKLTASFVIASLDGDTDPHSGRVRQYPTGERATPPEIYVRVRDDAWFWVKENGRYVSGFRDVYTYSRFNALDAWRIRRAVRRWLARHPD
jgi:hypothetical protein